MRKGKINPVHKIEVIKTTTQLAELIKKYGKNLKSQEIFNLYRQHDLDAEKMIDELNGVLAGEEIEDDNKPILNDTAPKIVYKEHTSEEVAEIILKQVSDDYLLEIAEQNFENFNQRFYVLLEKYKVSAADTKDILLKIQESFTPQEENENESETDSSESETE